MHLHHVYHTVPVSGVPVLRHFYTDLLGLPEIRKATALGDLPVIWFQVGEAHLHFRLDDTWERGRPDHHIAIMFDDLPPLLARLAGEGIDVEPAVSFEDYGYRRCYVIDPFGRQVELMAPL